MASISAIRAENSTLFEIDAELEAQFEAATNEEEQTGVISEEAKQSCLDLFAELGRKVDRIARYVRATEFKARAAKEEAARLTARQKTAEKHLAQVKSMLAFYMLSRGLRRLEGELNTIRLQKTLRTSSPTGSESAWSCRQVTRSPVRRWSKVSTFASTDAVFATTPGFRADGSLATFTCPFFLSDRLPWKEKCPARFRE
jgi:outer membrane murein-binding lipoprotein Lpp